LAHDVFISYSNKDKTIAEAVCGMLEGAKVRCWIAPRDVQAGIPFAISLVKAIRESKVFVLVLSDESNHSVHVLREVSEAVDSGIPIIPLRITDVELSEEMHYYIKSIHWLDAMSPPLERHILKLIELVKALLAVDQHEPDEPTLEKMELPVEKHRVIPRWAIVTIFGIVILIIGGMLGWGITRMNNPRETAGVSDLSTSNAQLPDSTNHSILTAQLSSENTSELPTKTSSINSIQDVQLTKPDTSQIQQATSTATITIVPLLPTLEPEVVIDDFGIPMILIPGGSFQMGSNHGNNDERPVHQVILDSFTIDQYEVTNAHYEACVVAGSCDPPFGRDSWTRNWYYSNPDYADFPVVTVNWFMAKSYCEWRGARLPTEAEWEMAARGGLVGAYFPWGEETPVCSKGEYNGAQYEDCSEYDTVAVGSFGPNGFGLYDMAGNVWEWVSSLYMDYPYNADDGREDLSEYGQRVLRGGGWDNSIFYQQVAYRDKFVPDNKNLVCGIRCAADVSQGE